MKADRLEMLRAFAQFDTFPAIRVVPSDLRGLLAALDAADALGQAGMEAIRYVGHKPGCPANQEPGCRCGAVDALKPALNEWHRKARAYRAARGA